MQLLHDVGVPVHDGVVAGIERAARVEDETGVGVEERGPGTFSRVRVRCVEQRGEFGGEGASGPIRWALVHEATWGRFPRQGMVCQEVRQPAAPAQSVQANAPCIRARLSFFPTTRSNTLTGSETVVPVSAILIG